ncbi:MAG TPA: OmpA family protein [Terriglobia bacterium]|nr:OmpA family protein [Terriglobia bacterium]
MKSLLGFGVTAAWLLVTSAVFGQVTSPTQVQAQRSGENPLYRVTINVVERDIKAVNYRVRGAPTKVDFKGTALLPDAKGDAWVEGQKGYTEIKAEFENFKPATTYGPEYLTYVLWAITPEGRATNLGEVILDGKEGDLHVTTELQSFGMIVTAEPYFAVAQPSDVVVLENLIREDTEGGISTINAKFDLLKRGQYVVNAAPDELKPANLDDKTPLDLAQARNAVRIASWSGAQTYAADTLQKAKMLLNEAETLHSKKESKKKISTAAREAVQVAEDARLVTLKREDEARLAAEREAAQNREATARADAEREARLRAEADAAQRLEIERRARAEAEERVAKEKAEVARLEADRARSEANRSQQQAALHAEEARRVAERAERDKAELRANLMKQLNLILETRDSARGLIVNMSDVLFDTGQHTLKPGAREKLAKVSGILLSHPGLKVEVEGHTDSVGTDDFNQSLSERRAESVKTYLTDQGIPAANIRSRGFGESQPVASNDTAAGRQQNRRVELVVSGDAIGSSIHATLQ